MGTRPGGAATVARARAAFLGAGRCDLSAVRPAILASWSRSKDRGVPVDGLAVPYRPDVDTATPLARAGLRVLDDLDDAFAGEPVSLVLCDVDGTVVFRRTGDSELARALDRVSLAPGFSFAEQHVGTNGIGVALAGSGPARVFGPEHFAEHLEHLACAAAPVRHPLTGQVAGVVNLTCRQPDAGALLLTTAVSLARQIREALRDEAARRERILLDGFLAACRDGAGAVLAAGPDVVLANRLAQQSLRPEEQQLLVAEAMAALASGRAEVVVDLDDGQRAQVHCSPTSGAVRDSDVVLRVQLSARLDLPGAVSRTTARRSAGPFAGPRQAVRSAADQWLVLTGEPGAGRTRLALQAGSGTVLDVAEVPLKAVLGVLRPGARVVLEQVDGLGAAQLQWLTARLKEVVGVPDRPVVVLTTAPLAPAPDPAFAQLLELFDRQVAVPPLRARAAQLPALAQALLAEVSRGRALRLSPRALEVLAALPWPGNVAQLREVLVTAAVRRGSGTVDVEDLPADLVALARRPLTPLDLLERDALLTALARSHGSKDAAARALGMSRATVYRRVRHFGLSR